MQITGLRNLFRIDYDHSDALFTFVIWEIKHEIQIIDWNGLFDEPHKGCGTKWCAIALYANHRNFFFNVFMKAKRGIEISEEEFEKLLNLAENFDSTFTLLDDLSKELRIRLTPYMVYPYLSNDRYNVNIQDSHIRQSVINTIDSRIYSKLNATCREWVKKIINSHVLQTRAEIEDFFKRGVFDFALPQVSDIPSLIDIAKKNNEYYIIQQYVKNKPEYIVNDDSLLNYALTHTILDPEDLSGIIRLLPKEKFIENYEKILSLARHFVTFFNEDSFKLVESIAAAIKEYKLPIHFGSSAFDVLLFSLISDRIEEMVITEEPLDNEEITL
jgi:hypothetical protein